jgi:hypothetical protein
MSLCIIACANFHSLPFHLRFPMGCGPLLMCFGYDVEIYAFRSYERRCMWLWVVWVVYDWWLGC